MTAGAEPAARMDPAAMFRGIVGVGVGLFHLWALNFASLPPEVFLPMSLWGFFVVAVLGGIASGSRAGIAGWLALLVAVSLALFHASQRGLDLAQSAGLTATSLDIVTCVLLVLAVLFCLYRLIGWPLTVIVGLFLLHPILGDLLPGPLNTRSYSAERLTGVFLTQSGLFSSPLSVVVTYVVLFVYFGKVMELSGAGAVFMKLVLRAVGRATGGPAKVAVCSSALFGSISGSGVADTVTTGSLTIPMMKRDGVPAARAAAIEAVASSGAPLLPPVMGAAAFLMAENLMMPYHQIIILSIFPAFAYFAIVLLRVHLLSLADSPERTAPDLPHAETLGWRDLLLLTPVILLVYMLAIAHASPIRSATFAMLLALAIYLVRSITTPGRIAAEIGHSALQAAVTAAPVVFAAAGAALLVGSVNLTGLSFTMTEAIRLLAGESAVLTLVMSAFCVLLFGMGLPPTVSYILGTVIIVPVLRAGGFDLVASHFFVFFLTAIANVTPPVGMSSFAASGIAGERPLTVSLVGMRLLGAVLLTPFLMALQPDLLGLVTSPAGLALGLCALAGMAMMTTAEVGWKRRVESIPARAAVFLGALGLLLLTISV